MKKLDKLIIGIVLGGTFPVLLALVSTIGWFYIDRNEKNAPIYFAVGIATGLCIDAIFLKKWIKRRYELRIAFIAAIYIIGTIVIYGTFMGFPVFNLVMGVIAGYYFGKRILFQNIQLEKRHIAINHVSLFTGIVMAFICFSTATIALLDNSIGQSLQMMFNIHFEITKWMIATIAVIGGSILVVLQYLITKKTINITLKKL